jgi:hypothetical protein
MTDDKDRIDQKKCSKGVFLKMPRTALINFATLVCLFSLIAAIHRYGVLENFVKAPANLEATPEHAVVELPEDSSKTSSDDAEVDRIAKRLALKRASRKNIRRHLTEMPAEELDSETARQSYLVMNRRRLEQDPTSSQGIQKVSGRSSPDYFIPYEKKSGQ